MHNIHYKMISALFFFGLLLGCWNNHVALFQENDPAPLEVYPVQIALLPAADQELLLRGIPVENGMKLRQILEDMLS